MDVTPIDTHMKCIKKLSFDPFLVSLPFSFYCPYNDDTHRMVSISRTPKLKAFSYIYACIWCPLDGWNVVQESFCCPIRGWEIANSECFHWGIKSFHVALLRMLLKRIISNDTMYATSHKRDKLLKQDNGFHPLMEGIQIVR